MSAPLLEVRDLTRSFYGVHALEGVDVAVPAHRITGLIGPNGAGKTTLFNCISGVVPPSSGRVVFDGRDITGWRADRIATAGLVRTFQIARGFPRLTVYENLLLYGNAQPGELKGQEVRLASVDGAMLVCGFRTESWSRRGPGMCRDGAGRQYEMLIGENPKR